MFFVLTFCWDAKYFDRTYCDSEDANVQYTDDEILKKADDDWRHLVDSQPAFVDKLNDIFNAVKNELLN